jgi:fibronectin-binding autotransporter adhesin
LFGLILAAGPAAAQSGTWSQATAGTYNWSNPANWAGGVVADGVGNTASFTTASLTGDVTVTLDGDRTIGNLTFDNPTNTFSWTLAGTSVLTLSGGTSTIAVNNANITATINTTLAGTAIQTSGPGTLVLTGNNTFFAGLNVTAGTVVVQPAGSNNPLGSGAVTLAINATLAFRGLTPATATYANALNVPGATPPNFHVLTTNTSINVTLGPLTLGNQAVLVVQPDPSLPANQPYSFTFGPVNATIGSIDVANNGSAFGKVTVGPVSGVGPFNVADNGIVVLTAPGNYTVGTNVEAGRLIVTSTTGSATGSNQVDLAGGTLGGVGTIVGGVVFTGFGTLAPGDPNFPVSSPGILRVASVRTATGSHNAIRVKLNGATTPGVDYDQLIVTGGITVPDTLITSLGYAPSPTDTLTIIQAAAVNSQFIGLPDGASFLVGSFNGTAYTAVIHYTPASVYLTGFTPVPEPRHALLIGGLAAVAWRQCRRRTRPS